MKCILQISLYVVSFVYKGNTEVGFADCSNWINLNGFKLTQNTWVNVDANQECIFSGSDRNMIQLIRFYACNGRPMIYSGYNLLLNPNNVTEYVFSHGWYNLFIDDKHFWYPNSGISNTCLARYILNPGFTGIFKQARIAHFIWWHYSLCLDKISRLMNFIFMRETTDIWFCPKYF